MGHYGESLRETLLKAIQEAIQRTNTENERQEPAQADFLLGNVAIDKTHTIFIIAANRTPRTSLFRQMCPKGRHFYPEFVIIMTTLKPSTNYAEQMTILKEHGCIVDNEAFCLEKLKNIGYYRLSAYFLTFKDNTGRFAQGTTFETIVHIYEFDEKLRRLLSLALEDIEIFFKATLSQFHADKYGTLGYLDAKNFSARHNKVKFNNELNRIIKNNEKVLFVKHHLDNYGGHFPLWVASQLFTFGMLSYFYADMTTHDQKLYSSTTLNLNNKNLQSWLQCCAVMRNICAHYGRLYFRIFTTIPAGFNHLHTDTKTRLWGVMLVLKELYPSADKWNSEILYPLKKLFKEYSNDINLYHLAFPQDWAKQLKK